MSEGDKQRLFNSDARASVVVLLYEFATGEVPSNRDFGPESAMSKELRLSSIVQAAVMRFQNDPSQNSFRSDFTKSPISTHLDALPDALVLDRWSKMFLGSYDAAIHRIDSEYIQVTITNPTGLYSLMGHLMNDVPEPGYQFSTVRQTYNISIYAPE